MSKSTTAKADNSLKGLSTPQIALELQRGKLIASLNNEKKVQKVISDVNEIRSLDAALEYLNTNAHEFTADPSTDDLQGFEA